MASTSLLRSTRLLHLYLGVFIAPSLLFFAFTGTLQVFSLHETTRGSSYVPPRWAVVLGQIHKKQTAVVPSRNGPPGGAKRADASAAGAPAGGASPKAADSPRPVPAPDAPAGRQRHPLPLKIFFAFVSLGLFTSVVTGIYMSYKYTRRAATISALLLAGTALPIALVFV